VHPSLTLFLWLCGVLLAQRLPPEALAAIVLIGIVLSGAPVRRHWLRLLRRTRWLLLILAATFLLLTPGERVYPGVPLTWEGASMASEHLLRLVGVLFAVAWLLGRHSLLQIVSGLYGIAQAFGAAALQRGVVRLALVLQYVERGEVGDWRRLLRDEGEPLDATLVIHYRRARIRDWCLGFCGLLLTLAGWLA
jgi:hypothetical protein